MYTNTRFGELLKGLSRGFFDRCVDKYEGDKYSKGFKCWDLLLSMTYGQLTRSRGLRELTQGFNQQPTCHYHLGTRAIKRSTLSEAYTKKDRRIFEDLCHNLLNQAHRQVKKELKEMLYLIDATLIPLKGLGYDDWAAAHCDNRVQGLKIHMMYNPDLDVPVRANTTYPKVNDIVDARDIELEPDATYVFDKAYYAYNWWHDIDEVGARFVTRFKRDAALVVLDKRKIAKTAKGIVLRDEKVRFKNKHPGGGRVNKYDKPLRRIVIARDDNRPPLILATNDMRSSALKIAMLYKKRWAIELCFKWIKQNLNIKRFYGRSENGVRIQLYTAIVTYLLIAFYRNRNGLKQSMRECLVEFSHALFQRPGIDNYYQRKRDKLLRIKELQNELQI
jgi:hypothetical protein